MTTRGIQAAWPRCTTPTQPAAGSKVTGVVEEITGWQTRPL